MPEIEEYKQELRTALYRGFKGSKLIIYQRFFKYIYHNLKYINDSTKDIDLPTNSDTDYYL